MVNIYETPIRPAVDLEDAITVYVPGYAYFGPEEPTLCYSLSEFEGLYGSTPYLFESDQTTSKIAKGSPEKGYLYAKALLEAGLQVLFHRCKTGSVGNAEGKLALSTKTEEVALVAQAISFGPAYEDTSVQFTAAGSRGLYNLVIKSPDGKEVYSGTISLDPSSALYLKQLSFPLVEFKAEDESGNITEIPDSLMMAIVNSTDAITLTSTEVKLALEGEITGDEFLLDGATGMLKKLATSGSAGLMYPLTDFERYPSVTYLTSGGYYVDASTAGALVSMADQIKAIALVDLSGIEVNDPASWATAQAALSSITGTDLAKGKSAAFIGCNSFDLSPYRIVLGDSFNYLTCLAANVRRGVATWIPVANDPNGVSPLGYASTSKIDTALSETIAEGTIGVSANPLIYSTSAGGYKIMGNRTLLSNSGVLGPNSFLNVSVVVNRVERACRQAANKLKIVSTSPTETFNKFKASVTKTLDPMVVTQDGIQSYTIKLLPKTKAATIDIQIALVVVEGIETFNIYIPYSISVD